MRRIGGYFCLFMAFTMAGSSVVAARYVSDVFGPFFITAASLFIALLFLLPFSLKVIGVLRRLPLKGWLSLACQAFFGIFLFRLLLVAGLRWTSASEAGILTGATPAVTSLLAIAFLKEKLSAGKLFGVVSTVFGILLLQGLLSGSVPSPQHLAGNLLVLGAAVSEAVFNVISRIFAVTLTNGDKKIAPAAQTTAVVSMAFLFSLIPAALEGLPGSFLEVGAAQWLALLWYGGAVTALGYFFWYAGIRRSGALTAAAFSGMMPLSAMLLSVLLLGEGADPVRWAGGALVTAGMVIIGIASSGVRRRGRSFLLDTKGGKQS